MKFRHKALTIKKEIFLMSFAFLATVSLVFSGVFLHILYKKIWKTPVIPGENAMPKLLFIQKECFMKMSPSSIFCPGRIQSSMAAAGIRPLS